MKFLYKRKLLIIILVIMFIFKSMSLPHNDPGNFTSKEGNTRIQLIKAHHDSHVLLHRVQFEFERYINAHINDVFVVFTTWKFILYSLIVLRIIIDMRKRIAVLITSYFEGSKYKDSFHLSH